METGRETDLRVHHSVLVHGLDELEGDTLQRGACLHEGASVAKPLQLKRQRSALRSTMRPGREFIRFVRGQLGVSDIERQIDDRLRPETPVQMLVKEDFRQSAKIEW